jgi:hypothetical protein
LFLQLNIDIAHELAIGAKEVDVAPFSNNRQMDLADPHAPIVLIRQYINRRINNEGFTLLDH